MSSTPFEFPTNDIIIPQEILDASTVFSKKLADVDTDLKTSLSNIKQDPSLAKPTSEFVAEFYSKKVQNFQNVWDGVTRSPFVESVKNFQIQSLANSFNGGSGGGFSPKVTENAANAVKSLRAFVEGSVTNPQPSTYETEFFQSTNTLLSSVTDGAAGFFDTTRSLLKSTVDA